MSIVAAYAVPHPPLIIPAVGRGQEREIQSTIDAYREVARRIAAINPETIIVTTPHAPFYRDGFHVTTDDTLSGSMAQFRAPKERVESTIDQELVQEIADEAEACDIPLAGSTRRDQEMDHATFIPLWFVDQALEEAHAESVPDASSAPAYRVVRIGLSTLPPEVHRILGQAIARAVGVCGRRTVFIASGDLSHKLKKDGPYGFAPEGPEFDKRIAQVFESGNLDALFDFDEAFCDAAAECGMRSFQIMAGALSGTAHTAELLSCEGPFGVGYAVAAFETEEAACSMQPDQSQIASEAASDVDKPADPSCTQAGADGPDPYVALARASVEAFVRTGSPLPRPDELPDDLLNTQASTFVSLHMHGELRGCIGTIAPTCDCVADEIIHNGILACSEDPRFPPVREDELDFLEISVDVLAPAEAISSIDELDPARYGVIVTKGWKRGLLLPNLDGIDTAEDQVAIAKRKAGISPFDSNVQLERFEVVRHTLGGEARREK